MKSLLGQAREDIGIASDCLRALIRPDPDLDPEAEEARGLVGGALLAEGLGELRAIRQGLSKA